jgi:pimeloyl-ACP methyl ester carboxylesterase
MDRSLFRRGPWPLSASLAASGISIDVALAGGLFIRTAGPPTGRTLLFLHGFAGCGLADLPLFDTSLAERYRLVVVDLAGFGASPRQDDVLTIAQHAEAVATFARSLRAARPIGLIAHSVGSMIAVEAAALLGALFGGLFSIEGNLTADAAYFSGRAADFDDPVLFKQRFLDDIWNLAQTREILRRYYAAAVLADPTAMWALGRDARRLSINDAPGRAYRCVRPSLYYWSPANTAETTSHWVAQSDLDQLQLANASHWPTVDQPNETARAIASFYDGR